jgi:lipid A oxidase
MNPPRRRFLFLAAGLAVLAAWPCPAAFGQVVVSIYGGEAVTADSDVKLALPGQPTQTFKAVSWRSESFVSPFYYGLRLAYWLGRDSNFGLAVDFTHAKMLADADSVTVVREGTPGGSREPLSETFNNLSFSHGHNLLTVNFLARAFPAGGRDRTPLGRLQPYAGLGLGLTIPHVEVDLVDGSVTDEYQLGGFTVGGLAGISFDVLSRLALFLEYKLNWAAIDGELAGDGRVELNPWTHQFVFGASFSIAPTLE